MTRSRLYVDGRLTVRSSKTDASASQCRHDLIACLVLVLQVDRDEDDWQRYRCSHADNKDLRDAPDATAASSKVYAGRLCSPGGTSL